jgi:flagellar export protein FliJ
LPRFLFSLETLLRHREGIEQREQDELFRLNYRHQTELRHRDDLNLKFRETMNELALKQMEHSDHQELNWFYLYINRLTREIGESEKRIAQLEIEVQAQKEVVIEASKKRKVLASLRSKKEKEFVLATEKQEQKDVDDLVITRFTGRESDYQRALKSPRSEIPIKNQS